MMPFAPSRPLLGVPSRSLMAWSTSAGLANDLPRSRPAEFAVDVADRAEHALAAVAGLVPVTQFHGLPGPG